MLFVYIMNDLSEAYSPSNEKRPCFIASYFDLFLIFSKVLVINKIGGGYHYQPVIVQTIEYTEETWL